MIRRRSAWPEQDVVVLAEEAHRRRDVAGGRGASGRSNSSRPSSSRNIASRGRSRSNDRLQPRQAATSSARPSPSPGRTRRGSAARRRRSMARRSSSRPVHASSGAYFACAARAPDAARRHLHERDVGAHGVADRLDVVADPARDERAADLARGQRPVGEQLARARRASSSGPRRPSAARTRRCGRARSRPAPTGAAARVARRHQVHGRRASASAARPRPRSASRPSSCGSNPRRRDHSPR